MVQITTENSFVVGDLPKSENFVVGNLLYPKKVKKNWPKNAFVLYLIRSKNEKVSKNWLKNLFVDDVPLPSQKKTKTKQKKTNNSNNNNGKTNLSVIYLNLKTFQKNGKKSLFVIYPSLKTFKYLTEKTVLIVYTLT